MDGKNTVHSEFLFDLRKIEAKWKRKAPVFKTQVANSKAQITSFRFKVSS
jgi:hypothetical protein